VTTRPELLEATGPEIEDAVAYADPMVLRGLLFQLTGDEAILRTRTGPPRMRTMGSTLVMVEDPEDVERLRRRAVDFLISYRDQGAPEIGIGPEERLPQSLALSAGAEIPPSELEMWMEQLGLDPFARGLQWDDVPAPDRIEHFSVVVIGAGMGGLNAAVQLKHAGIPFVVVEKNPGVGGTWFENRYPGARVDVPSRTYGHVFSVDYAWDAPFCSQVQNEKYFNWVADHFELRDDIEFDTEVTSVRWDDGAKVWEVRARSADGPREWRPNAVICAVGLFGRPNMPDVEGSDSFGGVAFHTTRWPAELDLADQRVAVVGSGCTGYQMVPVLRKTTRHTYLLQRTPSWVFDTPGYLDASFAPQVSWLDQNVPFYSNFMRFRITYAGNAESAKVRMGIDPDFHDEFAVSPLNKTMRDGRIAYICQKFEGRPDLIERMIPDAPVWSSRPVLVDRDYNIYDALLCDDVTLVSDPITRIVPNGIEVAGGTTYDVDVIIYATGFKANEFLWPMEVRGRNGERVEELWQADGARAYLGSMLPGFPNFFMLYGPNTNPLGGLGVAEMEEMVTRFALSTMAYLVENDKKAVEVTTEAYRSYNAALDEVESTKIYRDARAHNYYKNKFGRSATNMPFDVRLSWNWLRDPRRPREAGEDPVLQERLADAHRVTRPYVGEDLLVE
jgi:4-hydroxyacetophenone monooxygenase